MNLTKDDFKYHVMEHELGIEIFPPSRKLFEEQRDEILKNQEKAEKYSKILKWAEKGEIHNIHFVLHNYKKMSDQSLKNQEDAEIFREFGDITKKEIYQEYWKNYKIVERLKKRIEECDLQNETQLSELQRLLNRKCRKELQKILEGKE